MLGFPTSHLLRICNLCFSLAAVNTVSALSYQWDPNGTEPGLGGPGIWEGFVWDDLSAGFNDGTDATFEPLWTNSDMAVFGGVSGGPVTLSAGDLILNGMRFDTAGYTLSGTSVITLDGTTPEITANADAAVSLALSGTLGLVKSGAGNLTISGTNTYTGGTTLNGGTLTLSRSAGFGGSSGSISTGALTVNAGATVSTTVPFGISGNTAATNNQQVSVNGGTLNLSGSEYVNTYNLNGGIINAPTAANDYLRASAAGLFINSLPSATPSILNNKIDLTFAGGFIDTADGGAATDLSLTGVISQNTGAGTGSKTLTKSGAGTLVLSGNNSYSGGTIIQAGTVIASAGVAVNAAQGGALGTGEITVQPGATLKTTVDRVIGGSNITRVLNLTESTANINGLGTNGTEYIGTVNLTGGTITADAAAVFFRAPNGGIMLNSLASANSSTVTTGIDLTFGDIVLNVADGPPAEDLAISGRVTQNTGAGTGARNMIKTGAGTALLTGSNAFSGTVMVNEGTLKFGSGGNAANPITTGPLGTENRNATKVTVASGASVDFNGQRDAVYGYTISGTGIDGSGALTNTGAVIGNGTKQASNITLSADASIGGSGNWAVLTAGFAPTTVDPAGHTLTKTGANTVSLFNTTFAPGTLAIAQGSVSLNNGSTLSDAAVVRIAGGATLNLTGTTVDLIDQLVIDDVPQPGGIYKPVGVAGEGTELPSLTGTAKLQVSGSTSSTFAAWLATYPPASGFATDSDNDSIPNGLENLFGTDPTLPTEGLREVSRMGNSVTFKHRLNPNSASDLTYSYQWSTDMVEWKSSGQTNSGNTTVLIAASAPLAGEVTVISTISSGPVLRLFTRIKTNLATP